MSRLRYRLPCLAGAFKNSMDVLLICAGVVVYTALGLIPSLLLVVWVGVMILRLMGVNI